MERESSIGTITFQEAEAVNDQAGNFVDPMYGIIIPDMDAHTFEKLNGNNTTEFGILSNETTAIPPLSDL